MHEAFADRICGDLPDAEREQPFGPGMIVWTIHGHMFAAYTERGEGLSVRIDGEAPANSAADGGAMVPPHTFTGAGWVVMPWSTRPEQLRRLVARSYDMVLEDGNGAEWG